MHFFVFFSVLWKEMTTRAKGRNDPREMILPGSVYFPNLTGGSKKLEEEIEPSSPAELVDELEREQLT